MSAGGVDERGQGRARAVEGRGVRARGRGGHRVGEGKW